MTDLTAPGATAQPQPEDWTEAGAWPVVPGVVRIPLPLPMDGLRAVNVYVLETDDGLVLVDGGWAIEESRQQFSSSMRAAGYRLADIRRFLVTHMHRDHYTQAYVLGQEVGAEVSLGIGDRASMELMHDPTIARDPNLHRLECAGADDLADAWQNFRPAGRPSTVDYGLPDVWLDTDLTLDLGGRSVEALATPGHTQGHYVFADDRAGLLFAGDHVLPRITPSIGFEPSWVDLALRDFMESLVKLRDRPDALLLPAHGPVAPSVHTRVDELLDHHRVRLDQCQAAVAGGAGTAWQVAAEIPWTRHHRHRDELGPFDSVLAAFETLAHLDLLAAQGRLERTEQGALRRFSLPGRGSAPDRPLG